MFVGEVTELTGTTYEDDVPVERGDGTTEYVGEAYTQDDGSLLVSGANSNILFDESAENLTNEENLESTEEYQKYSDAVDYQINDPYIDDVKSEYDLSNQ